MGDTSLRRAGLAIAGESLPWYELPLCPFWTVDGAKLPLRHTYNKKKDEKSQLIYIYRTHIHPRPTYVVHAFQNDELYGTNVYTQTRITYFSVI